MIDTHAHLYFDSFDNDRDDVIAKALNQLDAVVNIGVDAESNQKVVDLAKSNKKFYSVVGFNPESVVKFLETDKTLEALQEELAKFISVENKVVGIGEIGLDYYWKEFASSEQRELQREGFRAQIELAMNSKLPIIIHSRDAFYDTVDILKDYKGEREFKGVWHSFTIDKSEGNNGIGGAKQLEAVLELGLYVGVNGIVTFPSARDLQDVIKSAPLEKLLLETDSPFLAPQPMRGKRNESVFVKYVGEKIAQIKDLSMQEVVSVTDENAKKLFEL